MLPQSQPFFTGDWYWAYGIMLYTLSGPLEHLVYLSRGCPCHKVRDIHKCIHGAYHWIQDRREALRAFQKLRCVAKGLNSAKFATGRAIKIIEKGYADAKRYLMMDWVCLTKEDFEKTLNDFERAVAHVRYEVLLKLTLWLQQPLIMCAIAEIGDLALAIEYTKMGLQQYDDTAESARHVSISRTLCTGPVRASINEWIRSGGKICRAIFNIWRYKLAGVRTNEVSVESLHQQAGFVERGSGGYHESAHLSFCLRAPEAFASRTIPSPLIQWANKVAEVCSDAQLLERFKPSEHPSLLIWKASLHERHLPVHDGRNGMYKLARKVFYRCDLLTLFENFQSIQKAIDDSKRSHKKRRRAPRRQAYLGRGQGQGCLPRKTN